MSAGGRRNAIHERSSRVRSSRASRARLSSFLPLRTPATQANRRIMGPLQDPVTWYGINYTGTQITQWDFQNKGTGTSPAWLFFVFKVPLRHLRPSIIHSVPCDWILQRAYSGLALRARSHASCARSCIALAPLIRLFCRLPSERGWCHDCVLGTARFVI